MTKDLLKNLGKTFSSPKSFNNELGVPISLANLSVDDKFGVFEVGMSRAGEIKNLTKLIKPHIGVITNVGEAHLENFKDVNGIANAKSEIIEQIKNGGTIILNRDDKFFDYLFNKAKKFNLNISTFGFHKKSDIRAVKITKKEIFLIIFVKINNQIIDFKIKDLNIHNVLCSLAVLKQLNVKLSKIKSKFKVFESPEGRGKNIPLIDIKNFKLIDESYNANPLSVKNAIKKFNLIKKKKFKKFLILLEICLN